MPDRLVLTDCAVVDATDPAARRDQEIHVDGDSIVWVGPRDQAPPFADARRVALAGSYVLPGLGDAHAHLAILDPRVLPKRENLAMHMTTCLEAMTRAIRGGYTMMRILGAAYGTDIALREMFNRGVVIGPRMWVAGEALTPSGGHMAAREDAWGTRIADGVEGWRKAARDQLQAGADHVKAVITGGAIGPAEDRTDIVTIVEEELLAAAQVFQSRGKRVVVHAATPAGVMMAVRAGADTVEHGYDLDDAAVRLLADNGVWLTPTLSVTHQVPANLVDDYERSTFANAGHPAWYLKRREERFASHAASFARARAAGVKLLAGTDGNPYPEGSHCELAFLVRSGLSPHEAITAATRSFAEAVGAADRLGTVEPGKWADLIVVDDDPLEDITRLRHPSLVLRGGQIAHQRAEAADAASQRLRCQGALYGGSCGWRLRGDRVGGTDSRCPEPVTPGPCMPSPRPPRSCRRNRSPTVNDAAASVRGSAGAASWPSPSWRLSP